MCAVAKPRVAIALFGGNSIFLGKICSFSTRRSSFHGIVQFQQVFEEREVLYDENNFYDLGKLLLPKGALSSGSNTDTTGGEEYHTIITPLTFWRMVVLTSST